jgi:acetyl esterase/lipase
MYKTDKHAFVLRIVCCVTLWGFAALSGFDALWGCATTWAQPPLDPWPSLAPGETTRSTGEIQPANPNDVSAITRVVKISRPTFTVHLAEKPNGCGVVILPGGGFIKVVPDLEGTEAAKWLNEKGYAAFVLNYRTTDDSGSQASGSPGWIRPLQDAQRTLAYVRSEAKRWNLKQDRIGLLAFSAGGQVAARLISASGKLAYDRVDAVDDVSHRPDFAVLVYPWNMYDANSKSLVDGIRVPSDCPPTFLVHTDDDHSTSLGTTLFYVGLKELGIPSELHVYGNGGHGYGLRPVPGSQISSWPDHAAHWLARLHQSAR